MTTTTRGTATAGAVPGPGAPGALLTGRRGPESPFGVYTTRVARVTVDVDRPGLREDPARDLVHVVRRGESAAEIEELVDAPLGQESHRTAYERPICIPPSPREAESPRPARRFPGQPRNCPCPPTSSRRSGRHSGSPADPPTAWVPARSPRYPRPSPAPQARSPARPRALHHQSRPLCRLDHEPRHAHVLQSPVTPQDEDIPAQVRQPRPGHLPQPGSQHRRPIV
jgi:hypothetical protein